MQSLKSIGNFNRPKFAKRTIRWANPNHGKALFLRSTNKMFDLNGLLKYFFKYLIPILWRFQASI